MKTGARPLRPSLGQLKPLESVQLFFDAQLQLFPRLALGALAGADPIPLLHQELLVLPVGLEIQRCDDVLADQNRQREIAELALWLRYIGFEQMVVIEEQVRALALDDQRIERREDMHELVISLRRHREQLRRGPMLLLARPLDGDADELAAPDPGIDQTPHGLLAGCIEMADRIERDHALRA